MWYTRTQSCPHFVTANEPKSDDWCANVIAVARDFEERNGIVGERPVEDASIRKSKVRWLEHCEKTKPIYFDVTGIVNAFNAHHWNFELSHLSLLQFTRYGVGEHYNFHIDMMDDDLPMKRKLSFIMPLNDGFEGGEFEFQIGSKPESVEMKKGYAVVFPSFLLHRVKPVTGGERLSLVGWVEGPSWK